MYLKYRRNNGYFDEYELIVKKGAKYSFYVGAYDLIILENGCEDIRIPIVREGEKVFFSLNPAKKCIYPKYLVKAIEQLEGFTLVGGYNVHLAFKLIDNGVHVRGF